MSTSDQINTWVAVATFLAAVVPAALFLIERRDRKEAEAAQRAAEASLEQATREAATARADAERHAQEGAEMSSRRRVVGWVNFETRGDEVWATGYVVNRSDDIALNVRLSASVPQLPGEWAPPRFHPERDPAQYVRPRRWDTERAVLGEWELLDPTQQAVRSEPRLLWTLQPGEAALTGQKRIRDSVELTFRDTGQQLWRRHRERLERDYEI